MKPTFSRRNRTRSRSESWARFAPSNSIDPAVGRSMAPMRLRSVVFPHPDGPRIHVTLPTAKCASSPRSAITSRCPRLYTLIKLETTMSDMSPTSKLEDFWNVHTEHRHCPRQPSDPHRREQRRDGDRGGPWENQRDGHLSERGCKGHHRRGGDEASEDSNP